MRPVLYVAATITVATLAGVATAGHESLVTVLQPLDIEGPGILLGNVSYVGYGISRQHAPTKVLLTTRSNSIPCDTGAQDRNAAAREKIVFVDEGPDVSTRLDRRWPRIRGDTLEVRVDLSAMAATRAPKSGAIRDWQEYVLTAALYCGIANVRGCEPAIRFVKYMVEGDERFARYSGTYAVSDSIGAEVPFVWESTSSVKPLGQ